MTRSWSLVVDMLGRPLTANAAHRLHHIAATRARGEWRDAVTVLARQARIPRLSAIRVVAQARYETRKSISDCDAISPTVKGALDGLVAAGVIVDDRLPYVLRVTYEAPLVGTGLADALLLTIEEAS